MPTTSNLLSRCSVNYINVAAYSIFYKINYNYSLISMHFSHQSTNCTVRLVLIVATAALTSFGTTSPRYIKQQAIYFPCLGSHFAIMLEGSNTAFVISGTDSCSWYAFAAEITGAYEESMKWIRGYGTRLVWNSVTSTLMAPSNLKEVVKEDIIWEISRFKLV